MIDPVETMEVIEAAEEVVKLTMTLFTVDEIVTAVLAGLGTSLLVLAPVLLVGIGYRIIQIMR